MLNFCVVIGVLLEFSFSRIFIVERVFYMYFDHLKLLRVYVKKINKWKTEGSFIKVIRGEEGRLKDAQPYFTSRI